jgi:hypothetical protein
MQFDRRFADYGLTGGFFLICQLLVLWAFGYGPMILDKLRALRLPLLTEPSLIGPIITGFAGALGIIAVFVVGLLLDLLASLFRSMEMRVFARHLSRNSDWLINVVETHKAYCGTDHETIQRAFPEQPIARQYLAGLLAGLDVFMFWKREKRERYVAAVKLGWAWGLVRPYERLWSFFTSYIVVLSGSAQLTLLVDQYSLWRTARAIATALQLISAETFLLFFWVAVSSLVTSPSGLVQPYFLVAVVSLAATSLSMYITLGTYSRLCFTLFSLVYVTYDKQIQVKT